MYVCVYACVCVYAGPYRQWHWQFLLQQIFQAQIISHKNQFYTNEGDGVCAFVCVWCLMCDVWCVMCDVCDVWCVMCVMCVCVCMCVCECALFGLLFSPHECVCQRERECVCVCVLDVCVSCVMCVFVWCFLCVCVCILYTCMHTKNINACMYCGIMCVCVCVCMCMYVVCVCGCVTQQNRKKNVKAQEIEWF